MEIAGNVTEINCREREIKPQQNSEVYDSEAVTTMHLAKKNPSQYWNQICNRFLRNC